MPSLRRAAFLDRDGVINIDNGYVSRIADFEFFAGAMQAMQQLQARDYQIVIITNQSGIGRGYFSEQQFAELTAWMIAELARASVAPVYVYHCPHNPPIAPALSCACRKPEPGMILSAARDLSLDVRRSILVGDKPSDIMAGHAAGVRRCFQVGMTSPRHPATHGEFAGLASLVDWLIDNDDL